MSAFLVSDNHIDTLITFAARKRITFSIDNRQLDARIVEDANDIGQILVNQNVRSVNARYSENDIVDEYIFRDVGLQNQHVANIVQILKACDCYDYQACETDDYRNTTAASIIDRIRSYAIHSLPGWEEAEWAL